ncbi:uncharacterized protein LOC143913649 [Arctopsyche grandis]|uniref:uncharacterized protein LOC143913649 n=1 Tax=Arctopsyche grandis TaxID=121162 RepID=UPI00406D75DD
MRPCKIILRWATEQIMDQTSDKAQWLTIKTSLTNKKTTTWTIIQSQNNPTKVISTTKEWLSILVGVWSMMGVTFCQYQHTMQLQYPGMQRIAPANMIRTRTPMVGNRPRWPLAGNQIHVPQRPHKPFFTYMKGPPNAFRGQKPALKHPNAFANYWKNTMNYHPTVIKDMFRNPLTPAVSLGNNTPQIVSMATSAQKLLAASSPVKSMIVGSSPSPNLLSGPLTKNYLAGSVPTNNVFPAHLTQTSRPLTGPATAAPAPLVYPIRVDGDGGPIHTIPAPNLSLADKPIVVPDYQNYVDDHANKIKSGHTYEVTEDTNDKNALFTDVDSISPSNNNYFSAYPQQSQLPQASALRAQPMAPSLTSEELFALLSDGQQQQQLADAYSFPLLQQPQLQQHYIHQSFDHLKPIQVTQQQAFNAMIQPASGGPSSVQNILFKPDPKYMEKLQEQILRQSIVQPVYQSFNYQEPVYTTGGHNAEKLKTELKALREDFDLDSVHYNVVRSTKESIPQAVNDKENNSSIVHDSAAEASHFVPSNAVSNGAMESTYLAEIDNIASSSISPAYYAPVHGKDTANTLATLQAAGNLINVAQNEKNFKAIPQEYFANMNQYFVDSSASENDNPVYGQQYDGEYMPQFPNDGNQKGGSPIRIFVPEDYDDDINTQPTENIRVSASMNTDKMPKNDMTIIFDNEETDDAALQQYYDDLTQEAPLETNSTFSNLQELLKEHNVHAPSERKKNSRDLVVMVPQNATNPTLDILTKDWKTSIIINSKTNQNQVSEFGNRIRPKRD